MTNLYYVNAGCTEGTYMFLYVRSALVAAENEEEARIFAKNDADVIGLAKDYDVDCVGTAKNGLLGVLYTFSTKDY